MARGEFRADLFFRLNEFTIHIPPLRQRREDILYLAHRFRELTNIELNKQVQGFTALACDLLIRFDWLGNVRQLRNTIRQAVLLADNWIDLEHLNIRHHQNDPALADTLNPMLRLIIFRSVRSCIGKPLPSNGISCGKPCARLAATRPKRRGG